MIDDGKCNARFPPFRCRSSVAVSPFPYTFAAAVVYPFAVYGCKTYITTAIKLATLQQNGRRNVHDACDDVVFTNIF